MSDLSPAENSTSKPLNRDSLAIGVLSITATIMLVGIFVIVSLPTPAMGLGQLDRGGDYVMLTYQFLANWELVMITDGAVGRMAAYFYNLNNQTILLWDSVELARFMRQGGRAGAGGAGGS